MATTNVTMTGPVFDGQASAAAQDFTRKLAVEIAGIGRDWIKLDTERMDKSGRGGTGAAASGVKLEGGGADWTVSGGVSTGVYAWPWLEGTSKRNQSTGFKGYHTFRRTRLRMRTQVTPYAQSQMAQFIERMGGG
jgi:uncharacterized protein YodC (DUF2158 family)